jgi:CheY-like chemotaxis protein
MRDGQDYIPRFRQVMEEATLMGDRKYASCSRTCRSFLRCCRRLSGLESRSQIGAHPGWTRRARSGPRSCWSTLAFPTFGRQIRAPSVRLITLTGYGQAADGPRVREAEFDAHLVKPVSTQQRVMRPRANLYEGVYRVALRPARTAVAQDERQQRENATFATVVRATLFDTDDENE